MDYPYTDPANPYGTPFSDTANYMDPAILAEAKKLAQPEEGKAIHDRTEPDKGPLAGNPEEMGQPTAGDGTGQTNATPPQPPGMLGGIGQGGPSWRGLRTGGPPMPPGGPQQPQGGQQAPPRPRGFAGGYQQMQQGGGDGAAMPPPETGFGPPPVNPDPWKKQQVAETEQAIDKVNQRGDLNPMQKQHALRKLGQKLNQLDPGRQYRRGAPMNTQTAVEKYVAQNVHIFPEHGIALAIDGQGKPHFHTLPQNQQIEAAKFQHQQQLDLAKTQHQTSLNEMKQTHAQALAEQKQQHAQMLAEMKQKHDSDMAETKRGHTEQDQFLSFHKHLSDLRQKQNDAISANNQKMVEKGTTDKMRDNLPEIDMDEAWNKYQKLKGKMGQPAATPKPATPRPAGMTDEDWADFQKGAPP